MGMDANQIVLGMITRPDIWKDVKIIKINTPKLKKFLGVPESEKYISFSEAFGEKNDYLLAKESEKALLTKPIERGTYEKDIIKVDEKLNIIYSVFNGALLNIFPKVYDEQSVDDNFKWYSPIEAMQEFSGQNQAAIGSVVRGLFNSTMDFDWNSANNYIDMIALYQDKVGTDIKPTASKINAEIVFNKLDIFFNLTLAYVLLGFIMVVLAFVVIFKPEFKPAKTTKIIFAILTILFAIQTFGMGYRWYLSGHAPWSDIYETLTKLDQNIFIKNARTAFKENISEYEIADDEKAKLTAQYEAQVSIATISEIIKLAKETPLNEAQIKNLQKDTDIKIEQEKIAKEQVCGEKAKTKLIIQQIVTEQYRHRDLRASIKVKIASNEVTKQQAKFEEARRHIALQSNNQNTFMKKADYKVQQLQALAQDDKVVISADQISDTKTTIEAIPTQIISYNTEVQVDNINIPDTEIATPVINCEE
jgi:hypothetical protein